MELGLTSEELMDIESKCELLVDPTHLITVSYAQSFNGYLSTNNTKTAISGAQSTILTHYIRSKFQAILVGRKTIEIDNPTLNCRYLTTCIDPRVVILDTNLILNPNSKALRKSTIIFHRCDLEIGSEKRESFRQVTLIPVTSTGGKLDLRQVIEELRKLSIHSIMVEGGASIIDSFIQSNLVDQVIITTSPKSISHGGGCNVRLSTSLEYKSVSWHKFGADIVLIGKV